MKIQALTLPALACSLLLATACQYTPATSQPAQNPLVSNDPFIAQARLALANYQETDAALSDSQTLANQAFTASQTAQVNGETDVDANDLDAGIGVINAGLGGGADITGNTTATSTQIDGLINTQLSGSAYAASIDVFNRAAGNFTSQLAGVQGVEIDALGHTTVNYDRLRADTVANLEGDSLLANASLDLNGQLHSNAGVNLTLNQLQPLGFDARSSEVVRATEPDGSTARSVLLTFQGQGTILTNQVRVTGIARELSTQELKLRSETAAKGFTRVALREVARDNNGQVAIDSDAHTRFSSGAMVDIIEKRFINAQGAGAGIGTFALTDSSGTVISGSLRSVAGANGRLMLIMEPSDSSRGRLVMQETGNGHANLLLFNSQGQQLATSDFDLRNNLVATANS